MTQEEFDNLKTGDRIIRDDGDKAHFIAKDDIGIIIRWGWEGDKKRYLSNWSVVDFLTRFSLQPKQFPQNGDEYITVLNTGELHTFTWRDDEYDQLCLAMGIVFRTDDKEAAQLHAKWLLSDDAKEAKAKWLELLEKPWEKFKGWRPPNHRHPYYAVARNGLDWAVYVWFYDGCTKEIQAVVNNRAFPYNDEGRRVAYQLRDYLREFDNSQRD